MSLPYPSAPAQSESRSVLAIPAFRKLWRAMAFSSFGDWLGLLASTALAQQLAGGDYAKANFAIAGVFIVRFLLFATIAICPYFFPLFSPSERSTENQTNFLGKIFFFHLILIIP